MRSDPGADTKATEQERPSRQEPPLSEGPEQAKSFDEPLRLVHHHAGYVRVQAGEFVRPEDDDPIVAAARTAAEGVPGFRSWSLNPKTGSVVIQYEPGAVEADDLLKHIAKSAGFHGVEVATRRKVNRQEVVSAFLDEVQGINRVVGQMTGGRADLRELGPVALAALSVVSFIVNDNRGRLPQWSSALYHSYRVFMHWHRPEVRTRERAGRQEDERAGAEPEDLS